MTDAPKLSDVLAHLAYIDEDTTALHTSLYGIEERCPECTGIGQDDNANFWCSRCKGKGSLRQGGLVERVEAMARKALAEGGDPSLSGVLEVLRGVSTVLEALRTELGEGP